MIRIESLAGPVPVEAFLRAAREVSFVAADVGHNIANTGSAEPTEDPATLAKSWRIVDVQIEAPNEAFRYGVIVGRQHHAVALQLAPPDGQEDAPTHVRQGVWDIAVKCTDRPAGFSDNALRSLRRVAHNTGRKIRVTLSAGQGEGHAVALDEAFARHIDGWLNGQTSSVGSVEGRLELISIHDRMRFTIYGRSGLRVECLFPEAMLTEVKAALGERVCLRGRIRYRRDGLPATVEAQFLKTLPLPAQIPALHEVLEGLNR
jgi:hypothetical protein